MAYSAPIQNVNRCWVIVKFSIPGISYWKLNKNSNNLLQNVGYSIMVDHLLRCHQHPQQCRAYGTGCILTSDQWLKNTFRLCPSTVLPNCWTAFLEIMSKVWSNIRKSDNRCNLRSSVWNQKNTHLKLNIQTTKMCWWMNYVDLLWCAHITKLNQSKTFSYPYSMYSRSVWFVY